MIGPVKNRLHSIGGIQSNGGAKIEHNEKIIDPLGVDGIFSLRPLVVFGPTGID